MGEEQIYLFFKTYPKLSYHRTETIVRAEEPPEYLYYILNGFVRQYMVNLEGDDLTINIYKPKSYFLTSWMFQNSGLDDNFEALTEVKVHKAPITKMMAYVQDNPQILLGLTRRLSSGLRAMTHRVESLAYGDAKERVAATILNLAMRFGRERLGRIVIKLPVTHKLVASIAGLARETTSIEMESLVNDGVIAKIDHAYEIRDMQKLKAIAEVNYDL